MKIEFVLKPNSKDIDFLTQQINDETSEFPDAYSFALFIRDNNNQIIAGCNGSLIFSSIHTDQLWVHSDYRKVGLGRKLMVYVHDYGRKNLCTMATVATMSFQNARNFYEKLGYVLDFERSGYSGGSSLLFLKTII